MKIGRYFFQTDQFQYLLDKLHELGYQCIGPQIRDGAIIFDTLASIEQLPQGISDDQRPGHYSLKSNGTTHYFNWANGPQAIKPFLFTPHENLWHSEQHENGQVTFTTTMPETRPLAIIGARACDVAALKLQDQHFLQQQYIDPYYKARRDNLLVIAVNCNHPAATCFCYATGDGPFVEDGADIVLTELEQGFLLDTQSNRGKIIVDGLSFHYRTEAQMIESESLEMQAAQQQKKLPSVDIKSRLMQELNSEVWHDIAAKCLSCGNCTAVCPTCFCHSESEAPSLDGRSSQHYREWDSCFSQGHSYIHGVTIRSETSQRYRQWITHKFSSWHAQYGRSGCVGCGRCIAWCPVGIDVTETLGQLVERRHD